MHVETTKDQVLNIHLIQMIKSEHEPNPGPLLSKYGSLYTSALSNFSTYLLKGATCNVLICKFKTKLIYN